MNPTRSILALFAAATIVSGCGGSRVAAPVADDQTPPGPPERLYESVWTIAAHGQTLVSSIHEGIARSTNAGESWTIVSPRLALDFVSDGTRIFAATNLGVARSQDDGLTWEIIRSGPPSSLVALDVSLEGSTLAAAFLDDRIYVSSDFGDSWQGFDLPGDVRAYSVLVHDGVIYVGTHPGYVFRSSDGGQTWTPQQTGILYGGVRSVVAHNGKLFAAVSQPLGVLVSTDGGVNWEPSQDGLPTEFSTRWLYSIRSRGSALFAGTNAGIYRSTDDGATWSRLPLNGNPQFGVVDSDDLGGSIFAGTIGNGVHRSDDDGATWVRLNDVGTKGDPVISVDDPARPNP